VNWAYTKEHDAVAALPPLSPRRPFRSLRLLLGDHGWLLGFGTETAGWLVYVAALRLAPLSLVQAVSASGIAVLALFSVRGHLGALTVRERLAVGIALLRPPPDASSFSGERNVAAPLSPGQPHSSPEANRLPILGWGLPTRAEAAGAGQFLHSPLGGCRQPRKGLPGSAGRDDAYSPRPAIAGHRRSLLFRAGRRANILAR